MSNKNDKKSVKKLVEELREYLAKELRYTPGTMRTYAAPWDGLVWFAEQHGEIWYSQKLGERFLREYYGIPENPCPLISASRTNINKYVRAVRMVGEFHVTGAVSRFTNLPEYKWHSEFAGIFIGFVKHLESINTRSGTKMTLQYSISGFDKFIAHTNIKHLEEISSETIHEYILSLADYKSSSIGNHLLALKKFFAYIFEKGYVDSDMSAKVPRPKTLTDYGVPDVFTRDEINRVLMAVNRKTAVGKRDYAMLAIGADLGIRQCDLLNLEPSSFDWENNKISFVQLKTGASICLPLPERVGLAVIDYLKNGRPETTCKKLFVMHKSPYGQFSNAWNIIDKYMTRAGIENLDNRRHGFHSLRHSIAGAMLDTGTPLPVIAEVLGHINTNTTSRYLKIDVPNLRGCALEVTL